MNKLARIFLLLLAASYAYSGKKIFNFNIIKLVMLIVFIVMVMIIARNAMKIII